ncbi:hypothetical protein [Kaistia sp. MMO-174]|uniref:hypothetical protein n=1 Tax=Kaistia sp. MMO-174 TaxID=3081256 RepID=UPI003018CFF1
MTSQAPSRDDADERIARVERALRALRAIPDGKPGDVGTIPCPVCSKPLHYHYPEGGFRLRAYCETPMCVGLLE